MTRIKICGITNLEDAVDAARLGADTIGFILAPSQRRVATDQVRDIVKALPPFVTTVGVFMDEEISKVNEIIRQTGIDAVQLHGHESPEYCEGVDRRVIKRIDMTANDTMEKLSASISQYHASAYLLDPGTGSGKTFDHDLVVGIDLPVIIGGGLTAENVRGIVKRFKPYGVDVCSGIELYPGKKDRGKLAKFIREVRSC